MFDQGAFPRQTRDPQYLLRLRDKALARMAQDEALVSPPRVTRRWFALAAGAAVVAPSAFAGTLRNTAPQYGAPGLPGNPPLLQPKTFATQEDLKFIDAWTDTHIYLVKDRPGDAMWGPNTTARTVYYKLPSNELVPLTVVSDPKSKYTCIVSANEVFYVSDGTDLLGCRFGIAELIVTPSFFKIPTPPDGLAGAISQFAAQLDNRTLSSAAIASREIHISLVKDDTAKFWGPSPGAGRRTYPFLYAAGVRDGILEFSCNYETYGTFRVDLKSKKLLDFKGQ